MLLVFMLAQCLDRKVYIKNKFFYFMLNEDDNMQDVEMRLARLNHESDCIEISDSHVPHNLYLRGLKTTGSLYLNNSKIDGELRIMDGQVSELKMDDCIVSKDIIIRHLSIGLPDVQMKRLQIGGDLIISNCSPTNLHLQSARVKGNVYVAKSDASVFDLSDAYIGGDVYLTKSSIPSVDLSRSVIGGSLVLDNLLPEFRDSSAGLLIALENLILGKSLVLKNTKMDSRCFQWEGFKAASYIVDGNSVLPRGFREYLR